MEMPIELDIEDEDEDEDGQLDEVREKEREEGVTVDQSIVQYLQSQYQSLQALKEAPEKDLVDLAGILGQSFIYFFMILIFSLLLWNNNVDVCRYAQSSQSTSILQCTEGKETGRRQWNIIRYTDHLYFTNSFNCGTKQ